MNPTLMSPPGHLHRVRALTCYRTLRVAANVVAVFGFLVSLLVVAVATHLLVTGAASSFANATIPGLMAGPLPGLALGAFGLILATLTEVTRQCVIILADLADLSIAATILATPRQGDTLTDPAIIPAPPDPH